MVTRSVVVFVVRDGNPKKLQDLERPAEARRPGDHAEPVHLGRRALERHGRVRRRAPRGQDAEAGRRLPRARSGSTSSRSRQARAKVCRRSSPGRGDVFLAYENEAIFAQKKGQPVQFVIPKATILIENPIAVTSKSKHKTEANAFLKYPAHAAGAADLRARTATARSSRARRRASTSRPGRSSSRSSTSAAGRRSRRSSSTRAPASWRSIQAVEWRLEPTHFRHPGPGARVAPGLAIGFSTLYLSVIVLLPLAALAWRGARLGRDRERLRPSPR